MSYIKFITVFKNVFENSDHLIQCSPKKDHVGNFFKTSVPEKMKKFFLVYLFQVAKKRSQMYT